MIRRGLPLGLDQDRQLNERGFFVEVAHPVVGRKPIMRLPWLQDPGPDGRYWAAPTLGQHNDLVFRDLVGLSNAEIAELRASNTIK